MFEKIQHDGHFAICMDIDEPFSDEAFFAILENFRGIKQTSRRNVLSCFGPAHIIDEVCTNQGRFNLSKQFEDIGSGIDVYSDSAELMEAIYDALSKSEFFQEHIKNTNENS